MDYKPWIYLPIEVKVRESDAKLLLAYYAAKEGYNVVTGDHVMVELASEVYPKGIFFSKGYPHGFRRRVLTNAKNNGHSVVELDEEGLLINEKKYLRDRMKNDMLELVTQEYCWGQFQKDIIIGAYPYYEDKCHVVGNPRLDLLKPKFKSLYKQDSNQIKSKYGEFVLINTRFSQYNSAKGKKDNVHFKHIKKLYYSFIDMVKLTSEKHPNINFVIRPHPGENFESYRKEFSKYDNVHVVHEGNIINWLMAAKAIIHNGCTSGIEAFLLGKPVISYVPFNTNEHEVVLANQLGIKATDVNEIHALLKDMLKKEYIIETHDQTVKDLNYNIEWSIEKFAYKSILSLCNNISLPCSESNSYSHIQESIQLKDKKKRKRRFSLTEIEIQRFYKKLNVIENDSNHIIINKLGNNLFNITTI